MSFPSLTSFRRNDSLGSLQYLVYLGWLIIELVFVVTYVIETKGHLFLFFPMAVCD